MKILLTFFILSLSGLQLQAAETEELHVMSCLVLNVKGQVKYEFAGDYCVFLNDGTYVSSVLMDKEPYVVRFGVYGEILWRRRLNVHHQMKLSRDKKKIIALTQEFVLNKICNTEFDNIEVLDIETGQSVLTWRSADHLKQLVEFQFSYNLPVLLSYHKTYSKPGLPGCEYSHMNSVYEIPENKLSDVIPAFKPGNYLVNYHLIGPLVIIDEKMQKILWEDSLNSGKKERLDIHDPQILPSGEIIYIRNSKPPELKSTFEIYNPVSKEIRVLYPKKKEDEFYSFRIGGIQVVGADYLLGATSVHEGGWVMKIDSKANKLYKYLNPNKDPDNGRPADFQDIKIQELSSFLKLNYKARTTKL